jgi:predicted nucleic acid-binding protein
MAVVADSGALYALYDRRDRHHSAVKATIAAEQGTFVIPAAILSELDYLLRIRLGPAAERRFLEGIEQGAFTVANFTIGDALFCRKLLSRYESLDLGLADASVIATAERLGVRTILTVDERDFRAVRTERGEPFILLPADRRGQ